ncbi:hypothetical protein OSB04_024657 [Centaurea solstitialis]|uniref:UBN2 domain-containing protein n=1 Tax=Centaurea solstitialis TaxID=347529 RepID=A0AA38SLI9_9ASTR|nr:hypothetical protein OSB04_024657 [Centaurea solstitialis]
MTLSWYLVISDFTASGPELYLKLFLGNSLDLSITGNLYYALLLLDGFWVVTDSRNTAKELWNKLEKQFQGTERSIQGKLNQAIRAYEGFKALEGKTLVDSYSRLNIILNDLRRNGMQKSTSEINFKFLKNLNPEWDHYSVNLQMYKNLAEEDLHDLYSILSQHEVKVKDIV